MIFIDLFNKNGYYELKSLRQIIIVFMQLKRANTAKPIGILAWNIPAYKDLNINPSYNRLEVYGVNIFEPQVSLHETYMGVF